MLEVINLAFDYSDKPLLHGIELVVHPGTLLHLRGGNGTGKTTLLKLLVGILHPMSGDIRYDGHSISSDKSAFQQQLCYVGHKSGISPLLTVRENCHFELHNNPSSPLLDTLLTSFSLEGLANIPCHLLSVGQRRRVGLLRLLMSDVPLWFLDEPLVALDKDAVAKLMEVMDQHLGRGGLIVLSSHQNLPLIQENYQEYVL